MNNLTIGGMDPRTASPLPTMKPSRAENGCASDQARRFGSPHPHDKFVRTRRRSAGVFVSAAGYGNIPCGREAAAMAGTAAGTESFGR